MASDKDRWHMSSRNMIDCYIGSILPTKPTELETDASEEVRSSCSCRRRQLWAVLLKKVWDIDALKCPKCGGKMSHATSCGILTRRV
jgi:hypothetical protein